MCSADIDRAGTPGSFSPSVLRSSAALCALSWSEASSSWAAEGPWSFSSSSPAGRARCSHRLLSTCPYLKRHACLTHSPGAKESEHWRYSGIPNNSASSGALLLHVSPFSNGTDIGVQAPPPPSWCWGRKGTSKGSTCCNSASHGVGPALSGSVRSTLSP